MNRTDRLLAIVLELQGRGRRRSEDLAATFEVSKRTIYRDIEALCEMGVPVVSVPGRGYSLVPGYFLPPLRFTTDEAIMLTLGSDVMAQSFDAEYKLAAESAGRKIMVVLPEELRGEVEALQDSIRFVVSGGLQAPSTGPMLQQIRSAIISHHVLGFEYHTRHGRNEGGSWSYREVDPYALLNVGGSWYVAGYCHMRKGVRNFRVQRIEGLRLLDTHFSRPSGFKFGKRLGGDGREMVVRAIFSSEIAAWVRESPSFFRTAEEDRPDGLLVTFIVREESDILQYILSWGRRVRVLEPPSLAQKVAQEAEATLQLYKNPEPLLT